MIFLRDRMFTVNLRLRISCVGFSLKRASTVLLFTLQVRGPCLTCSMKVPPCRVYGLGFRV